MQTFASKKIALKEILHVRCLFEILLTRLNIIIPLKGNHCMVLLAYLANFVLPYKNYF